MASLISLSVFVSLIINHSKTGLFKSYFDNLINSSKLLKLSLFLVFLRDFRCFDEWNPHFRCLQDIEKGKVQDGEKVRKK